MHDHFVAMYTVAPLSYSFTRCIIASKRFRIFDGTTRRKALRDKRRFDFFPAVVALRGGWPRRNTECRELLPDSYVTTYLGRNREPRGVRTITSVEILDHGNRNARLVTVRDEPRKILR